MFPVSLVALLLVLGVAGAGACTSIIVGSAASTDGSIYIARTDDTGDARSTVNNLVFHPARAAPATFRSNANGLVLELPGSGLSYTALPVALADPAAGRNASGETAGVNSAGVAVSGTETIVNSAAALAADPYNQATGLTEDAIPSLLLPQATSARQGMQLLGSWVESIGAGEGFGVLIADAREAWYIETASGHHWVAQRVPDHAFFVSANQGRFQEVDLSDSANVMHSPGLQQFAVANGLAKRPAPGRPLNFFKAFMQDGPTDAWFNYHRVCALQAMYSATNSTCNNALQPTFLRPAAAPLAPTAAAAAVSALAAAQRSLPSSLAEPPISKPTSQHKLSLLHVMEGLRNHFDGTAEDPYLHRNPAAPFRPIALLRTSVGHVTRLRLTGSSSSSGTQALPQGLAAIQYIAMGMPALSPFLPIYQGLPADALPPEMTGASPSSDPHSLFWRARRLQALVFQDWPALSPPAVAGIQAFERDVEEHQRPAIEQRYLEAVARGDEVAAQAQLAAFTTQLVQQASLLLVKLTQQAAAALGLPGVPADEQLVAWLDASAAQYGFHLPTETEAKGPMACGLGPCPQHNVS